MNIAVDARWIFPKLSGIGAYTQELLREFTRLDVDHRFIVLFDNSNVADRTADETGIGTDPRMQSHVMAYGVFSARNQVLLPALLDGMSVDVYHSPNYMIPLLPHPMRRKGPAIVTTVHDVIPLKFPDHAPKSRKTRLMPLFVRLMRRVGNISDMIITVSRQSKEDIHTFLRIASSEDQRVRVVYNGVSDRFSPAEVGSAGEKDASRERSLLYVGRADPYKNVPLLVKVLEGVRARVDFPVRLVLAGPPDDRYPEAIELAGRLGLQEHVGWTGYLSHDALADLYRQSDVLVHPSRYEGFGLQILEAMASGLPVVCSNGGSLPEVAGDAAKLVAPDDLDGYVQHVTAVLTDPAVRQELRLAGLRQAARFSWERAARETLDVYLAARPSRKRS